MEKMAIACNFESRPHTEEPGASRQIRLDPRKPYLGIIRLQIDRLTAFCHIEANFFTGQQRRMYASAHNRNCFSMTMSVNCRNMTSATERVRKGSKKYEPAVLKISPCSQCLSALMAGLHAFMHLTLQKAHWRPQGLIHDFMVFWKLCRSRR